MKPERILGNRRLMILGLASAAAHGALLIGLDAIPVFPPIHEPPSLVAVRLEPMVIPPRIRSLEELLGAMQDHRQRIDDPAIRAIKRKFRPSTVAIPPNLPADRSPVALTGNDDLAGANWDLLEEALTQLDRPSMGRRGAFEGTAYQFKSIRSVRSGDRWFEGKGRMEVEHKLYTYRCQFPSRAAAESGTERPWTAYDYKATIAWPKSMAGEYRFRMTADDGAILQIDGQDVIDHDHHRGFVPKEGSFTFTPGVHTIRIAYLASPREHLGLILHAHRVGTPGWELFDLRPILFANARLAATPIDSDVNTSELLP